MAEAPFVYPALYWAIPVAVVFALLGYALVRKIIAGLFMGLVGILIYWVAYEGLMYSQMEKWLQGQRAYAIIFQDFPQDKKRFVSEYVAAFKTGGGVALEQKQEEMKIIMMEHHVKHYIDRTPTAVLRQYIVAETWLLSKLSEKNKNLCQQYLMNSKYFANVWSVVGSEIFLASIRCTPQMISGAVDNTEPVTPADRLRAIALFTQMMKSMVSSGAITGPSSLLACDTVYREFYMLAQMPPKDGALVLKLMLSENHLQQPAEGNILQKIFSF